VRSLKNDIVSREKFTRIKIMAKNARKGTGSGFCHYVNVYENKLYWYKYQYHFDGTKFHPTYNEGFVLSLKSGKPNIYRVNNAYNVSNHYVPSFNHCHKKQQKENRFAHRRFAEIIKKFCKKHELLYFDTNNTSSLLKSICYSPCRDILKIRRTVDLPSIPVEISGRFRKVKSLKEFQDRFLSGIDLKRLIKANKSIIGIQKLMLIHDLVNPTQFIDNLVSYQEPCFTYNFVCSDIRKLLRDMHPVDLQKAVDSQDFLDHIYLNEAARIYCNKSNLKIPIYTTFQDMAQDFRNQ